MTARPGAGRGVRAGPAGRRNRLGTRGGGAAAPRTLGPGAAAGKARASGRARWGAVLILACGGRPSWRERAGRGGPGWAAAGRGAPRAAAARGGSSRAGERRASRTAVGRRPPGLCAWAALPGPPDLVPAPARSRGQRRDTCSGVGEGGTRRGGHSGPARRGMGQEGERRAAPELGERGSPAGQRRGARRGRTRRLPAPYGATCPGRLLRPRGGESAQRAGPGASDLLVAAAIACLWPPVCCSVSLRFSVSPPPHSHFCLSLSPPTPCCLFQSPSVSLSSRSPFCLSLSSLSPRLFRARSHLEADFLLLVSLCLALCTHQSARSRLCQGSIFLSVPCGVRLETLRKLSGAVSFFLSRAAPVGSWVLRICSPQNGNSGFLQLLGIALFLVTFPPR